MTVLLASLLAVVTIANLAIAPVILYITLSDRQKTDDATRKQLEQILNRIQAPEVAVATSVNDQVGDESGFIPVTDDVAMNEMYAEVHRAIVDAGMNGQ